MDNQIDLLHIQNNTKYSDRVKNTFKQYLLHTKTPDTDQRTHKIKEDRLYLVFISACIADRLDHIQVHFDLT